MATPMQVQQIQVQVSRARESLGAALALTQDIGQVGLNVDAVNASLAKAVRELFTALSEGPTGPQRIHSAMGHLQETLASMQDVGVDDQSLEEATATVARSLAILFPVLRTLEAAAEQPVPQAQPVSQEAPPEPIPLTQTVVPQEAPPLRETRKSVPAAAPYDSGRERRTSERRAFEVDIGIQSETNFFTGFSMDISSGGLFVATYDIADVGTEVNVNFSLPNGPMMSLNGTVRWVRDYNETAPDMAPGMGVMFEDLSPAEEDAINTYLASSNPLFYE